MFSVSTLKLRESYCIWVFLADENSHKKALKILFQQNFRIFKIKKVINYATKFKHASRIVNWKKENIVREQKRINYTLLCKLHLFQILCQLFVRIPIILCWR